MAPTNLQVKNTKPKSAPIKLSGSSNMHPLIQPNGGKCWRFNCRFADKQITLALEAYGEISLLGTRKRLFGHSPEAEPALGLTRGRAVSH